TPNNGSYTITSVTEDSGSGATVVAAVADYTYEFFNNGGAVIQAASTTATISGLAVGNYSVVVKRTSSQCSSASIPFSITDVSVAPIVSLTAIDNTSCNGGASANGSITADVTNNGGTDFNYTFTWFVSTAANFGNTALATALPNGATYNGATVTIGNSGIFTGNVLSGLPANTAGDVFWVRVTDTTDPSSNCRVDANETIIDNPATIVVTASTATPSNQCSPVNGSIELTAITINGAATNTAADFEALQTAGYTFRVLRSDAATLEKAFDVAANGGTNTFPTATALAPGTYFIEVTSDLGCPAALKQFSIGNT
ncbi:MAG: hypothetical protein RLP14_01695, partial [Owenweeksia sp.]